MDAEDNLGRLLVDIVNDTTSASSLSWYDTARVVSLWSARPEGMPPPLAHRAMARLMAGQNADGSWGYPAAEVHYRLVPTLSVVLTLRTVDTWNSGTARAAATTAAERGLAFLTRHVDAFAPDRQPDTVAVELLLPDLLESIRISGSPHLAVALDLQRPWRQRLHMVRRGIGAGLEVPASLWHSLETLGPAHAPVPVLINGAVSCSPAATAAALAAAPVAPVDAVRFLTAEAQRYAGGWPTVTPIRFFEAAWVVSAAAQSGARIRPALARRLRTWLATSLVPGGAIPGPGLPPDSDDTAGVLFALGSLGQKQSLDLLRPYLRRGHFATFPTERTPSVSTNAHVLRVMLTHGDAAFAPAVRIAGDYLADAQCRDGYWMDKWHASPYYATSEVVVALTATSTSAPFGALPAAATSVDRARRWLLDTQRPDGSWGVWHGTYEETSYAIHALFSSSPDPTTSHHVTQALRRGAAFLAGGHAAGFPASGRAPLWHGKELYEPRRIALGFIYSALHACAMAGIAAGNRVARQRTATPVHSHTSTQPHQHGPVLPRQREDDGDDQTQTAAGNDLLDGVIA